MEILLLCIKIFFARILDVSIGTVRMLLIVRNKKLLGTLCAFIEVMIWFMVAREALNTELTSLFIPIAYSAGYATGTFIGATISDRFIDSIVGVQFITTICSEEMINTIRNKGFAVSIIPLKEEDNRDHKEMLYIQLNKSKLKSLNKLLESLDSKGFIIVNETKSVVNGFLK